MPDLKLWQEIALHFSTEAKLEGKDGGEKTSEAIFEALVSTLLKFGSKGIEEARMEKDLGTQKTQKKVSPRSTYEDIL